MTLRYEWAFDLAVLGGVAASLTDDGGTGEAALTSGLYAHTSIAAVQDIDGDTVSRFSAVTSFAAALAAELNTTSGGSGTYTVTWNGTTGYTVAYSGGDFSLSFSGATTAAQGTLLRRILGFSADLTGEDTYSSDVRPYYLIIPSIQARSDVSDEYEPDGIMAEAVADDGTAYQISRDTAEIWSDWTQASETETAPSSLSSEGTLVFARQATATAPWTYEHAWRHMRLGLHPFLVVDSGTGEDAVHMIRAEGASFRPVRFAGTDQPYWSIPFRTRLVGRLP